MRKTLRGYKNRIGKRLQFFRQNRWALKTLSKVESSRGPLPELVRKQCNTYATEVLGSIQHAPWLYVYSAMQGRFREGWIPDTYYAENVLPRVNGENRSAFAFTHVAHRFLDPSTVTDLLYIVNGKFLTKNHKALTRSRVPDYLFDTCGRVVLKGDRTKSGKGVRVLDATTFGKHIDEVQYGVLQRFIQQPDSLAVFGSSAVATLRLTTVIAGGRPECRAACLRLGSASDTHVKSSSQIAVPVDATTGVLNDQGWKSWQPVFSHPDSDVAFVGQSFPKFQECVAMVKRQHEHLPYLGVIGWDVGVDINYGPTIMEFNTVHPGIKLSEAIHGPNFTGLNW